MLKTRFILVLLLAAGMVAASLACQPVDSKAAIDKIIAQDKEQLIRSVQELVQIKSVQGDPVEGAPFGEGPAKALDKALSIAKNLGFDIVNMDGYVGYVDYGKGDDYIAVLTHLDVVPEGQGWTYPPYAAEIHDGKIYGRGTIDDKGPAVASLFALKAIRDAGIPLSKRVRIIFGTNEETDLLDIPHYLKYEKPPVAGFTPDGFYPVINAEKGKLQFNLSKELYSQNFATQIRMLQGGTVMNSVPEYAQVEITTAEPEVLIQACQDLANIKGYNLTAEKTDDGIIVESFGKAAHASMPEFGQNAIMQLINALDTFPLGQSDISDAISFMAAKIDNELNGMSMGIAIQDEPSGELTLNVGTVNMTDDLITFGFDIRYPVTCKAEQVLDMLNQAIAGTGFKIENISDEKPLYFSADSPMVQTLLGVYREQTGRQDSPVSIGGASYARDLPNILCFGPVFWGETYPGHMPDESISIDHLLLNARIYANAIYKLAAEP
jgi:succinyl-diaminopimelate desuccinylase